MKWCNARQIVSTKVQFHCCRWRRLRFFFFFFGVWFFSVVRTLSSFRTFGVLHRYSSIWALNIRIVFFTRCCRIIKLIAIDLSNLIFLLSCLFSLLSFKRKTVLMNVQKTLLSQSLAMITEKEKRRKIIYRRYKKSEQKQRKNCRISSVKNVQRFFP